MSSAHHGLSTSSFHMPMRFMGIKKRHAMHVLYSFCREADNAVDDALNYEEASYKLARLRHNVATLFVTPETSDNEELAQVITEYHLKREYFDAILDGMEMDLHDQMLRPELALLTLYCYRVAGCVGILSLAIFGNHEPEAISFATVLGHALQLTNILRDIREDASRGRLYLPLEWLKEEGIGHIAPDQLSTYPEAVLNVCNRLADRALHYFAEAERLSHRCNRRTLLPALLMRDVYLAHLHQLKSRNNFLDGGHVRLNFLKKLSLVLQAIRYI